MSEILTVLRKLSEGDGRNHIILTQPAAYEINHEIDHLRAEIDRYDKVCAEVRNELTAAGIPELTEDRLTVVPLAKRVSLLATSRAKLENDNKKLRGSLVSISNLEEDSALATHELAAYQLRIRELESEND